MIANSKIRIKTKIKMKTNKIKFKITHFEVGKSRDGGDAWLF